MSSRNQVEKMAALKLWGSFSIDLIPYYHSTSPKALGQTPVWDYISSSHPLDVCVHPKQKGRQREEGYWTHVMRNSKVQEVALSNTYNTDL